MKTLFATALIGISLCLQAQDDEKKKINLKAPKLNIGEKIGKLAGNVLTGKTAELEETSIMAGYIAGIYPPEIKTSEIKFFPETIREGDHAVSISFFKIGGAGLFQIEGEVTCNGEPMEYVGLGSYGKHFTTIPKEPQVIRVKTTTGDEASFTLKPIPGVEIVSINGETSLPILDLAEDIDLVYVNPPGSEGTRIRVSLVTDVMGARALNHFASFPVKELGEIKVKIPKEALANPEIAGAVGVGNFNKGENYLVVERELVTTSDKYGPDQNPGTAGASELKTLAYAAMPVIVKGKQEEGILASLRVTGKSEDKTLGYEFYKPNANSGIPLSKASKFGLVSFTMTANTFKEETSTSSSSWSVGGTSYTRTTVTTTTYKFPELPDASWDYVMDRIYKDVEAFFKSEYSITFVPVENVTSTPDYATLFPAEQENNAEVVRKSYKGTRRSNPKRLAEIFAISTNPTADNPQNNMMKAAGELDGLVSIELNLQVAANEKGNIVLIPRLMISVSGRDETNNSKLGRYVDGYVIRTTGEPFNEALLKSSKEELLRVCSHKQMIEAMKAGIATLRTKEIEMGYDKIWSIGE